MKKLFSLFVSILVSTVLYSQETVHPQVEDSTAFKPEMTEAEMLASLQRQMTEIQLQINQIQYSLSDKSKESKALIPILANAMIGGGFSLSDYITWSIQPYVRYRFCHIIWKRLNLWGEFSVYAGQKIPRDPKTASSRFTPYCQVFSI